MPALSMFSNAGVGDFGYRQAGFTFHAHAELVKDRLSVCKLNHPGSADVLGDLNDTWPQLVEAYKERCDKDPVLLTAMPPCQGMSSASNATRASTRNKINNDRRNVLAFLVAKVASKLRPTFVVVENVPGILYTRVQDPDSDSEGAVAQLLAKKMRGYETYAATVQFADYGIPQRRLRTLLTFVRSDSWVAQRLNESKRLPFPTPSHSRHANADRAPWLKVREFLEGRSLPKLEARKGKNVAEGDALHFVPAYDERRYAWVANIPAHSGRGAFENGCTSCGEKSPPLNRATCPKCEAPLVARPHVEIGGGRIRLIRGHNSSYSRMPSNMPATTITTATGHLGSDSNIHPWENRLLSPRECALIQTIPLSFVWSDETHELPPATHLRDMIGEALPPYYGYLHGLALRLTLGEQTLSPLLADNALERQRIDLDTLEELQADRRRRLDAARKRNPRLEKPLC